MKKIFTGLCVVLALIFIQVIKQAKKYEAKQERKEKYLAGYYDNMSV